MSFISWIDVIIFIVGVLLTVIPITILTIGFHIHHKKEIEEYKESKYHCYDSFLDFWDKRIAISMTCWLIAIGAAIFALIWGGMMFTQISYWNHNEDTEYNMMIARQETISELLNSSDAAVKESLYIEAIEFNSDLAKVQSIWQKGLYSVTFSGDYDWSLIEPVKINK